MWCPGSVWCLIVSISGLCLLSTGWNISVTLRFIFKQTVYRPFKIQVYTVISWFSVCNKNNKHFSKEEGKDQESIQSITPNLTHHLGKWQKHKKTTHVKESQEVSPIPAGDHKAARDRQDRYNKRQTWNINNKKDPQKKHHLGIVSKKELLEGLNMFNGTGLNLTSDQFCMQNC